MRTSAVQGVASAQPDEGKGIVVTTRNQGPIDAAQAVEAARIQTIYGLGVKALARGDLTEAEKHFDAVLSAMPNSLIVLEQLATIYDRTGRSDLAIDAYRKIVSGSERSQSSSAVDPIVLARYGDLLAASGDKTAAAKVYRLAVAVPSMEDVVPQPRENGFDCLRGAAHARASIQAIRTGNAELALKWAKSSLDADGESWAALYHAAYILRANGKREEAFAAMRRAEELAVGKDKELVRQRARDSGLSDDVTVSVFRSGSPPRTLRFTRSQYERREALRKAEEARFRE
jgi:Tfp pilus assembly protein PilF